MAPVRLLVVQHDVDKSLGRIAGPLERAGAELDVHFAAEALPSPEDYDGLIALPGLADPVDDDPAVHRTQEVIGAALDGGLPVLGICLGGQILADVAGGEVYACTPELGFRDVRTTPAAAADALFATAPPAFSAFHAHAFAFTAPPGATVLAETDVCPQAFRLGDRIWGLQFHPEPPVAWVDSLAGWLRNGAEGTSARTAAFFRSNGIDPARLEADARAADDVAHALAAGIATGFLQACRRGTSA